MMPDHIPEPCEPLSIVLTGDEEWAERTPGISLKEYRDWLRGQTDITVAHFNPSVGKLEIEERYMEPLEDII